MRNIIKLRSPQQRRSNINAQLLQDPQVSAMQLALQISGDAGDSHEGEASRWRKRLWLLPGW